ncbi:MAG: hypothetical protein Q9164_005658 [Protoblastenia rupestris]
MALVVVRLIVVHLNPQVKDVLREHDAKSTKRYDGDIVRQIRISTLHGDTARREKWLARLSKNMQRCLLRLEALPEAFMEGWDALIPFTGLWPALLPGTFDRLLNLRCPEEMTRYLRLIRKTWTRILGEEEADQLQFDANTVAILQGRCPSQSLEDRAQLQIRMLAGDILPAFTADDQQSWILDCVCSIEHVIPSIHTFLEDTKYLEPPARILKELLPDKTKQSALHEGRQPRRWYELCSLASENDYRRIRRLYRDRTAADAKAIEDCVRNILPSKYYAIDSKRMRQIVLLNGQLLGDVPYVKRGLAAPELTSDHEGCGSDISDRCGRPWERSFQADEESLFLEHIYFTSYSTVPKRYLTSFAVKRDFFRAFFGSEEDDLDQQPSFQVSQDDRRYQEENVHMSDSETQPAGHNLSPTLDVPDSGKGVVLAQGHDDGLDPDDTVGPTPSPRRSTPSPPVSVSPVSPVWPVGSAQTSLVPYVPPSGAAQPRSPMYVFGQQGGEEAISLAQASHFVFSKQSNVEKRTFAVLSPTGNGRFRKRHADSRDNLSMTIALQLPSASRFIARDNGKRLKLMAPTAILEEARSERLQAVIAVSQHGVQELIRRFENYEDPEEEL